MILVRIFMPLLGSSVVVWTFLMDLTIDLNDMPSSWNHIEIFFSVVVFYYGLCLVKIPNPLPSPTLHLLKTFEANKVFKLSKVDPHLRARPAYTCSAFIAKRKWFLRSSPTWEKPVLTVVNANSWSRLTGNFRSVLLRIRSYQSTVCKVQNHALSSRDFIAEFTPPDCFNGVLFCKKKLKCSGL